MKLVRSFFAFLALTLLACAPSRPPIPPGVVPEIRPLNVEDEQYGHQVFQGLADQYEQDYNHPRAQEVQDIVDRLTKAAGGANDPWHVYIFKDKSVKNAAATRGNHVFIWSGLLDSTKNDAELATILAHEVSHVIAGHTEPDPNDEIKKLLINLGAMAAGIAVSYGTNGAYSGDLGNLAQTVTQSVGDSLLVLPYARDKELEADQVGMFLMAKAQYNPQAAIEFWSRAEQDPELSGTLGFLSTHPPAEERVERLRALLPDALALYSGKSAPPLLPGKTTAKAPPVNATPFDASGDTFAISAKPTAQGVSPSFGPQGSAPQWKLMAPKAIVYARPLVSSHKLGELKNGALIKVEKVQGKWLEISNPDIGYVRRELFSEQGGAFDASSKQPSSPSVP